MSLVKRLNARCFRLVDYIVCKVLEKNKKIYFGTGVKVLGMPYIDLCEDSKLVVGNEVTINSRNLGYHINMHSSVKIFADRPGAEISIGDKTRIHGSCIHAYNSIKIGVGCLIAANCQIMDGNGHDLSIPNVEDRINSKGSIKPVVISDYVWIGAGSFILPGVNIGRGSVISANSVVVGDIPPMVLAGGNPAKVIKDYRDSTEFQSMELQL